MWIMIANSQYIDFIHGDIHGRSCKKEQYGVLIMHALRVYYYTQIETGVPNNADDTYYTTSVHV